MLRGPVKRLSLFLQNLLVKVLVLLTQLGLVILLCGLAGFAWAWFLYRSQSVPVLFFKTLVVVGTGICTGLAARLIYHKNKGLLAWLSATLAMILCLGWLNGITGGRSGFNFLSIQGEAVHWDGLWQLCLGMFITGGVLSVRIPLLIRPKPASKNPAAADETSMTFERNAASQTVARRVTPDVRIPKSAAMRRAKKAAPKASPGRHNLLKDFKKLAALARLGDGKSGRKSTPVKTLTKKTVRMGLKHPASTAAFVPARKHPAAGNPIRLVGEEEHRCPYCLDLVDPQDPAGVVVCPVCHTYHHKSCWDVTGTCQVPHIHE